VLHSKAVYVSETKAKNAAIHI